MWFINGRPTKLDVQAVIRSVYKGYQEVILQLRVEAPTNKVRCMLVYPWAPNKINGGLQSLENNDIASHLEPVKNIIDNWDVYDRFRKLRNEDNIDYPLVQELCMAYPEDFGGICFSIETNKWWRISYKHKINYDSKLFFPTRLSEFIKNKQPQINYSLTVIDGPFCETLNVERSSRVLQENKLIDTYKISSQDDNNFKWEEDLLFATDNWESSDDDLESSDSEDTN